MKNIYPGWQLMSAIVRRNPIIRFHIHANYYRVKRDVATPLFQFVFYSLYASAMLRFTLRLDRLAMSFCFEFFLSSGGGQPKSLAILCSPPLNGRSQLPHLPLYFLYR